MISLKNISVSRGNTPLLEKANMTLGAYEKCGLIGRNGCGKSSLFALLLGLLQEEVGEVTIPDKWRIAHLSQILPESDKTALDFVVEGDKPYHVLMTALEEAENSGDGERIMAIHHQLDLIDGYRVTARAGEILHGLGFSAAEQEQRVSDFSGGWRMRLNLAQTLMCPSDLLLLDEPTNHLDLDAILWLEKWLQNYVGTALIIAHDSAFLDNVATSIAFIHQKQIELYAGNYSQFIKTRSAKLALQQQSFEKQQKTIAHLEKFINRFKAKASKAKQARSRVKALERMELVASVHIDSPFHFEFKTIEDCPNPIMRIKGVDCGYGDKTILNKLNIYLAPGDRIGLLGLNGAGKSTLMKLLAGKIAPMMGEKTASSSLKIGYFAQHQLEQLDVTLTPLEMMQLITGSKMSNQQIRTYLGGFDFSDDKVFTKIEALSGGEKARLVLAILVWQTPHLLLLDEPTNHLDLETREALTFALQSFNGAMVIVSHDRELLKETTDTLWLIDDGALQEFTGDMNDYTEWLLNKRSSMRSEAKEQAKTPKKQTQTDLSNLSSETKKKRKELETKINKLEVELAQLQNQLVKLEEELASPDLYGMDEKSKSRVAELMKSKKATEKKLGEVEGAWLEAQEELEKLS